MNLLLDTHIAIWALSGDPKLSVDARAALADPTNRLFVSAVSLVEIALKHAQPHRSDWIDYGAGQARRMFATVGFTLVEFTVDDACRFGAIEAKHKDPFDRMLLSQARARSMRLITHDEKLPAYGDDVLYV